MLHLTVCCWSLHCIFGRILQSSNSVEVEEAWEAESHQRHVVRDAEHFIAVLYRCMTKQNDRKDIRHIVESCSHDDDFESVTLCTAHPVASLVIFSWSRPYNCAQCLNREKRAARKPGDGRAKEHGKHFWIRYPQKYYTKHRQRQPRKGHCSYFVSQGLVPQEGHRMNNWQIELQADEAQKHWASWKHQSPMNSEAVIVEGKVIGHCYRDQKHSIWQTSHTAWLREKTSAASSAGFAKMSHMTHTLAGRPGATLIMHGSQAFVQRRRRDGTSGRLIFPSIFSFSCPIKTKHTFRISSFLRKKRKKKLL